MVQTASAPVAITCKAIMPREIIISYSGECSHTVPFSRKEFSRIQDFFPDFYRLSDNLVKLFTVRPDDKICPSVSVRKITHHVLQRAFLCAFLEFGAHFRHQLYQIDNNHSKYYYLKKIKRIRIQLKI